MASGIDANLEEYKKRILTKPSTIHEELDEETISEAPSVLRKNNGEDIYDQFL